MSQLKVFFSSSGLPLLLTSDYETSCHPAHGFHHVLSMTGNMSEFTRVIMHQHIAGNMDTPEGGLDAMLQAAVCQVCKYRLQLHVRSKEGESLFLQYGHRNVG